MTREEAIKILKAIRVYECYPKSASEETKEAIDMAIEALSAEVVPKHDVEIIIDEITKRTSSTEAIQGEWICKGDYAICSKCGGSSGTQYDGVERIPRITTFCPHCGVRMTKGGENE